jgi:hypothetical protein
MGYNYLYVGNSNNFTLIAEDLLQGDIFYENNITEELVDNYINKLTNGDSITAVFSTIKIPGIMAKLLSIAKLFDSTIIINTPIMTSLRPSIKHYIDHVILDSTLSIKVYDKIYTQLCTDIINRKMYDSYIQFISDYDYIFIYDKENIGIYSLDESDTVQVIQI